jgi:hypothetical protein
MVTSQDGLSSMVLIMGDIINVNQPKNLKTKVVKVQQG